jgi:uncharacterized coiled-coil protein SlyX
MRIVATLFLLLVSLLASSGGVFDESSTSLLEAELSNQQKEIDVLKIQIELLRKDMDNVQAQLSAQGWHRPHS